MYIEGKAPSGKEKNLKHILPGLSEEKKNKVLGNERFKQHLIALWDRCKMLNVSKNDAILLLSKELELFDSERALMGL